MSQLIHKLIDMCIFFIMMDVQMLLQQLRCSKCKSSRKSFRVLVAPPNDSWNVEIDMKQFRKNIRR